jgi:hypothetical protein
MATTTTVKAPPKAAKKTTTRPAAKRPAKRPAKATTAKAAAPKPVAAKPEPSEGGPVLKMFRSSLHSIEQATTMVGESSLGSMAAFGIPDGATKSLIDTQAKAMHSVMGMSESLAKTASGFLGKGLSVLAKPFKR